jgi:hypothetical protein
MKKQIVTTILGTAILAITATALFAQGNGNAIGGGAAGGPNGIYTDTYGGSNGNNTYPVTTSQHRKNAKHLR